MFNNLLVEWISSVTLYPCADNVKGWRFGMAPRFGLQYLAPVILGWWWGRASSPGESVEEKASGRKGIQDRARVRWSLPSPRKHPGLPQPGFTYFRCLAIRSSNYDYIRALTHWLGQSPKEPIFWKGHQLTTKIPSTWAHRGHLIFKPQLLCTSRTSF